MKTDGKKKISYKNTNPKAIYACVNFGEAVCPENIREQAICIDGDIGAVIDELRK